MRARKPSDPLVRANCFDCGTVEIEPKAMRLMLRNSGEGSGYSFLCPKCGAHVHRDGIEKAAVALLMGAGVPVIDQCVEFLEYLGRPPLTETDATVFTRNIEHLTFLASFARRECDAYRRSLLNAQ
jgi:hypothetical protein